MTTIIKHTDKAASDTKQTDKNKDVLINTLSQADQLTLPEGFENSKSWKRAQQSTKIVGSRNPGQWQISLLRPNGNIGGDYFVTFCLQSHEHEHESHILADCSCEGYKYQDICCHVLYFWWQFCQHNILVYDIQTREYHQSPPQNLNLREFQPDQEQEKKQKQEVAA